MEKVQQQEGAVAPIGKQSNEELLEDRMKCIAVEIELEKEQSTEKKRSKRKYFPISKKKPTREHLLIREAHDDACEWETDMLAKYMEGQVSEMLGRIMEHVDSGKEFPSEPMYHKWTKELMGDAKDGYDKFKKMKDTIRKYPMENLEQIFHDGEWTLYDRSEARKRAKEIRKP